jgi:hypothetical protein
MNLHWTFPNGGSELAALVPLSMQVFQADPMNSDPRSGHDYKLFRNCNTSGEFQSTELTNLRLNTPSPSMMYVSGIWDVP